MLRNKGYDPVYRIVRLSINMPHHHFCYNVKLSLAITDPSNDGSKATLDENPLCLQLLSGKDNICIISCYKAKLSLAIMDPFNDGGIISATR